MIKVFRRIRQKLLSENKLTKYLIYAAGEIILVVIGILIALQINNWNDGKKERQELQEYLAKISDNIKKDIRVIDSIKTRRIVVNNKCQLVVNNFIEGNFDLKANVEALEAMVDYYFVPKQSGYEALKNSGYLGKINGTKVDSLLDDYYEIMNMIIKEEHSFNEFIENMEVIYTAEQDMVDLTRIYFANLEELSDRSPEHDQMVKRYKALFDNEAYKAIVTRTAYQKAMFNYYDNLIASGKKTVEEIHNFTLTLK